MALIQHQHCVVRQVVKQGRRRLPCASARQVAGVIFNPVAVPQFQHHFQVIAGALLQALRLHQPFLFAQQGQAFLEFHRNGLCRIENHLTGRHVMRLRVDSDPLEPSQDLTGQRIEYTQGFHFLVEQFNPDRTGLLVAGEDIDNVATNPVSSAAQLHVIATVLHFSQAPQDGSLIDHFAARQVQHHTQVLGGIAKSIDCRYGRHDDGVRPLQQRLCCRQTHLLNVLVYRGVFFNVGIRGRHVGFGLVVVVIGNEVFNRIFRKKIPKLAIQLGGKGFVRRQNQRWPLFMLNHVGNGEGLA